MVIEGFVFLQHLGRYAIHNIGLCHELNTGDYILVDVGEKWIEMQVKHDFEGYYLQGEKISFYPKMVYARLIIDEYNNTSET